MNTVPVLFSKSLHEVAESHYYQTMEDRLLLEGEILSIEYYFDTSEVVNMIQGIWALDHKYGFDMNRFNSNEMLVYSLAFKNLLGKINMLPPHQDELVYALKDSSHIFPPKRDEYHQQLENELFGNLKISDLLIHHTEINEDSIRNYVQNLQLCALDLYKTDNVLRFSFWYDRYKYIFEKEKIVLIDNVSYDVYKIMESDNFKEFFRALEKHRGKKERSNNVNVIDAIAFTLFQEKLDAFDQNKKNTPLPIFYAGSNKKTYLAALDVIENKNLLTYRHNGHSIPAIRRSEYFILNVIYDVIDENDPDYTILKDIKDIFEKHKDKREELISVINKYKYYREIKEGLWDKITNQFFHKTWLENEGYKDMSDSILDYINYNKETAERVPIIAKKEREAITQNLQRQIIKFEWVQETISHLFSFGEVIDARFSDTNGLDIFRDLGMTRFSFTDEASTNIQKRVTDILDSYKNNEEAYRQRIIEVLGLIIDGLFSTDHQKLCEGMGILWVFEKHKLINKIGAFLEKNMIFIKYQYFMHHPFTKAVVLITSARRKSHLALRVRKSLKTTIRFGLG